MTGTQARAARGGVAQGTAVCRPQADCTAEERRVFAQLVARGFGGPAESRDDRIRRAPWLAFWMAPDATAAGVAAIKAPDTPHRREIFTLAGVTDASADYTLELGWVFVEPPFRGHRVAWRLCHDLVARVPDAGLMATTRPTNSAMMSILGGLGFARTGTPYPRREEELVLFLRPAVSQ